MQITRTYGVNFLYVPSGLIWSYLALAVAIIDDTLIGYVLKHISVLGMLPAWYFAAAIGSGAILLSQKPTSIWPNFYKHKLLIAGFLAASSAYAILSIIAIYLIGISGTAVISLSHYLILLIYGIVFLGERVSKTQLAGASIMLLGAAIFSMPFGELINTGNLCAITAAAIYAATNIFKKHIAGKVDHNAMVFVRACTMTVISTSLLFIFGNITDLTPITTSTDLALTIAFGGVVGAGLVHYFSLNALKRMDLAHYTIINMLEPTLIILSGYLLLNESLPPFGILGISVVIVGKLIYTFSKALTK